ncbi:transmembrane protein 150A-like isoform X2 [Mastacembelus armatus]|uniref:transmembrane protein 150A-like isoform X2 n=1 Tax=Mastacembelus armatus TaxID=205130 RepID=UPI000E45FE53|nr:transmembrane protein 150A-like isoform X2 [Mastacembelus armatus]
MSLWMIIPVSLPVFTITGIWVVYAMALYNQHVCPVHNWLYNESCEEQLPLQRGPVLCCTLENIPLISKCGTLPPESCFFSLICSTGSFMEAEHTGPQMTQTFQIVRAHFLEESTSGPTWLHNCMMKNVPSSRVRVFVPVAVVMLIGLLRYAHVIEKHQNCVLNTAGLSTGWICAAGLIMVGNFQVDFAKVLHYVGAGVTFPSSMLFVCLQSALTYRLAKTQDEYRMGHVRVGMTLLALIALVLSGVFFCQESFALQHTSAIFEWIYCMLIMLFYGTFAFEFGGMSGATLMVLSRGGGGAQSFSTSGHKTEVGGGSNHHQQESLSIL